MSASLSQANANFFCSICLATPWFSLPDEFGGRAHHSSRAALEASAATCSLCHMVLHAAIANHQGDDDKDGHWRDITYAMVKRNDNDADSTAELRLVTLDLGATQPGQFHDSRFTVVQKGNVSLKMAKDFFRGLSEKEGLSAMRVMAHAFKYDEEQQGVQSNKASEAGERRKSRNRLSKLIGKLKLTDKNDDTVTNATEDLSKPAADDETESLPVWVYGNYWAKYDASAPGDVSRSKQVLMGIGARFGKSHRILDAFQTPPGEIKVRGSPIRLRTNDVSPISQLILGRIPARDSSSELAFYRLQNWIASCKTNHAYCNSMAHYGNPKLPTRVLDVIPSHGNMEYVSLWESNSSVGKYTALSHTWGKSPRMKATRANYTHLRDGTPLSQLPKTFQDAVRITRRLGIRYLWIDCLCIIQDDVQDWEREAASMASIYRNSYLNIAASASSDSASGCFRVRDANFYNTPAEMSMGNGPPVGDVGRGNCTLRYSTASPQQQQPTELHFIQEWLPGSISAAPQSVCIGTFGKHIDPIAKEPLSTRGWTLQERLLSPRTVHFATDQLYFECETEFVSECGWTIPNAQFSLGNCLRTQTIDFEEHGTSTNRGVSFIVGKDANERGSPRQQYGWLSLVEQYSKRYLTVADDKLSALAGVARVLAEETGGQYLAGLWSDHLHEDMFWRVQTHEEFIQKGQKDDFKRIAVTGSLIGYASRPAQVRAPTWSWASVDAPIKFLPLNYKSLVCELRSCYVTPCSADNYGRVTGGFLDIDAPVFEVKRYKSNKPWPMHGTPVYIDLDDGRGRILGTVHLDIPQGGLPEPCYAVFLDPANAIIVRSLYAETSAAAPSDKPKRIFCSANAGQAWKKAPSGSKLIWVSPGIAPDNILQVSPDEFSRLLKSMPDEPVSFVNEMNHVERIGVGTFVDDKMLHNDFEESPAIDGDLVHFDPKSVVSVGTGESWGVISLDDVRIPVSIR